MLGEADAGRLHAIDIAGSDPQRRVLNYQRESLSEDTRILAMILALLVSMFVFVWLKASQTGEAVTVPIPSGAKNISASFRLSPLPADSPVEFSVHFEPSTLTKVVANLTVLLRGQRNGSVVLSKGIHERDLRFVSRHDSFVFYRVHELRCDVLELAFSMLGPFGTFEYCALQLQSGRSSTIRPFLRNSAACFSIILVALDLCFLSRVRGFITLQASLKRELLALAAFLLTVCLVDLVTLGFDVHPALRSVPIALFFGLLLVFPAEFDWQKLWVTVAYAVSLYFVIIICDFRLDHTIVMVAETVVAAAAAISARLVNTYRSRLVQCLLWFVCLPIAANIGLKVFGSRIANDSDVVEFLLTSTIRMFALGIAYVLWPCTDVDTPPYDAIPRDS
jgi:hypothetical protein